MEVFLIASIPLVSLFIILGISIYDYIINRGGVSSKEFTTNIIVNGISHKSEISTPISIKKTFTRIRNEEKWKVFFDYNGRELVVNNKALYNYCKDKKNKTIKVKMIETIYYDHSIGYEVLDIVD